MAYSNAIVKGVNDLAGRELGRIELGVEEGVDLNEEEIDGTRAYREWIWQRSCPGLEFTGHLPPNLEVRHAPLPSPRNQRLTNNAALQAVAFKLSPEHFKQVMSPISSSSKARNGVTTTPYELHEVECIAFEQGDHEKITGKLVAWIPIVVDPRYTAPNLLPTLRCVTTVRR